MQAMQDQFESEPERVRVESYGNALLRREEFAINLRKQKRKDIINMKRARFAEKNQSPHSEVKIYIPDV